MLVNLKESRNKVKKFIDNKNFDFFIMALILLDSIVFGLLTSDNLTPLNYDILFILDRLCMAIFLVEITLKIYVYSSDFFKSRWNIFDFIVITISSFSFASYFITLRTFRLFRILKYINRFSKLKRIMLIFSTLLPNFIAITLVFGMFLYVFAIIAVSLYGGVFIEFSTLSDSVFSLMQVFTLDGWASSIARPIMDKFPHSWVFFTSFLLISFLLIISFLMSVIDEIVKKDLRFEKKKQSRKIPYTKYKNSKNNP
ncbi:MAG: ion transporter [Alphaproteobacteria bacterium]|nr:ion transporter [Alphaproteobacteria bacterium]